jgi:uncharacterized membrane protein YcaP (DUF421 family)
MLTRDEVLGSLREHGISEVRDVRTAYLEGSGKLGVIKVEKK